MPEPTPRFTLLDLPFSARLTLAVFLCSVGIGYFSALVQLHAQQAKPGQLLPGEDEVVNAYHGKTGMGALEHLVTADENLPLTGSGSMRSAFTFRSLDWQRQVDDLAFQKFAEALPKDLPDDEKQDKWMNLKDNEKDKASKFLDPAQQEVRKERETEADTLAAWIHDGLDKESYDNDNFILPDSLKNKPLAQRFQEKGKKGEPAIKIKTLLNKRCVRCHQTGRDVPDAPLGDYKYLVMYAKKDISQVGGMPLRKLAQSTHVHLLGFSMLYMLTGLIFALSSWPGIIRLFISPLALLAQVVDISFWWLARLQDPYGSEFAKSIRFSGMVVAGALGVQIIGSLFSLFGWFGRFILVLLIAAALVGAYFLNDLVITPYLVSQAKLAGP